LVIVKRSLRGDEGKSEVKVFGPVRVSLDRDDHMRVLSWLVVVGVVAAILLAVFGLPETHFPPAPTWDYGIVMPSHGLTRASTALAKGQFGLAWSFNPAAVVLALLVVGAVVRWIVALFNRHWINVSVRFTPAVWLVILLLVVALSINQQLHADMLINETI
jgi:hypothetical protein